MKRLIIFLLLFAGIKVAGQTIGHLRFDTVMIYKVGGSGELVLMNSTKDTVGILTNYGNGRTRFIKSRAINDSTIVVGLDTLVIRGATGGSASTALTTIVRPPVIVLAGDSAMGIPDTVTLKYGYGLTATPSDTTLVVDTSVIASLDTAFGIMTRAVVVVDTIQFIHSGAGSATYQNNKLIGSKLLSLNLENYPVGFISRSTSVWMAFDPGTGTITLTNGEFAADDLVLILYRTYAIFLVDGNGDLVTDSNGNYIIVN